MPVLAVPVKSLERAKSRLSPVLSAMERAALTLAMLEDVLDAALAQEGWEVQVVSRADAVLEIAARRGARPVPEEERSLLAAIRQVEGEVAPERSELAVLLADLPLLTPAALRDALAVPASVVASPADSDGGTNLLIRRPHGVIPARFGRASFAKHRWAARRAAVTFVEVRRPEIGFDLDRPDDLARLLASSGGGSRTRSVCLDLGVADRLRVRA